MNIYILDHDPIHSANKLIKKSKDMAIKQVVYFLQISALITEQLELKPIKDKNGKSYDTSLSPDMPIELASWITFNGEFNNDSRYLWCLVMCKRISEKLDLDYFYENYFALYGIKEEMYRRRDKKPPFKDCYTYKNQSFINYAKDKENDYTCIKNPIKAYNLLFEANTLLLDNQR